MLVIFLGGFIWESLQAEESCTHKKLSPQINWKSHGVVTTVSSFRGEIVQPDF